MKAYRTVGRPMLLPPELRTSNSSDNCNWRRRYWARGHHKFQLSLVNRGDWAKRLISCRNTQKKGKGKGRAKNDVNGKMGKDRSGNWWRKGFVSVLYQKIYLLYMVESRWCTHFLYLCLAVKWIKRAKKTDQKKMCSKQMSIWPPQSLQIGPGTS